MRQLQDLLHWNQQAYFVGCQDGVYTVYINAKYVPESLGENFNADDYSYSSSNYLGSVPQFDD